MLDVIKLWPQMWIGWGTLYYNTASFSPLSSRIISPDTSELLTYDRFLIYIHHRAFDLFYLILSEDLLGIEV